MNLRSRHEERREDGRNKEGHKKAWEMRINLKYYIHV